MAQYPFTTYRYGPSTIIIGNATAAGATSIGTPAVGLQLKQILLDVTENATTGTSQENTISILLDGNPVMSQIVYMGTSGAGRGALFQRDASFNASNIIAAGGALQINIQTALTAGHVNVNAYFD